MKTTVSGENAWQGSALGRNADCSSSQSQVEANSHPVTTMHSPAAELCTAQSDRQLARPGISSTYWKVWQTIVQALPPDARKAAVGAYEHPGAVCRFAAPAAAEAHRHAAGRLLVAAAEHMCLLPNDNWFAKHKRLAVK
jgi:hypothetical protein